MKNHDEITKKVFVCEDDEGIIELVEILLQEKGYEVLSNVSGEHVLAEIEKFQPDLAILDLWMPRMSGEEITRFIKSHPTMSKTPVIILSATRDIAEIARRIGADAFLAKPFDIDEFEVMVEKILNK